MFIRSLNERKLEQEEFDNLTGETGIRIFPRARRASPYAGAALNDRDAQDIFAVLSHRVFPAVKQMKYGCLPDFNDSDVSVLCSSSREKLNNRTSSRE